MIDLEALLVALVLAPATYSRNRFFHLYTDPDARYVRRRASLVRSILRHASASAKGLEALSTTPTDGGRTEVSYLVSSLGLKRMTTLTALELSLVRFALARRNGVFLAESDPDRITMEAALRRLSDITHDESKHDFARRVSEAPHAVAAPNPSDRS